MERPGESAGDLSDTALRAAIDAASDGVLVVDDDGTVVFANPMLRHLFGYDAPELIGCPIELLIPDHLHDAHRGHRRGYMSRPRTRPMGTGVQLHGRHRDGHEFPVEIGLSPVEVAGTVHVIAVVRDVTERRRAADDLAHAQEQLALVDERERIARDLHDTVIQRLFAVGLSLQSALVRTETSDHSGRLETAIDEIDGTIRDIRTSIFALQSRRGLAAGARETVLQLAREAARALGFDPRIEFRGLVDTNMTDDIRDQFVPTLREALTNVVRHAEATRVEVSVEVDDDVVLRIADNGVGVPVDHSNSAGSGLSNMAERAEQLGGTCIIKSADRGGTVIEWRVPIDRGV